jgi:DDE superfamily endonuclease
MQDFALIYQNESRFLALTSLKTSEFESLLSYFSPICEKYFEYHDFLGNKRKFQKFNERKGTSLYGSQAKLFFILSYLKSNGLQEFIGTMFAMSQGKVSQWLKVLLPLLHQSLKKANCMPAITADELYQRLITVAKEENIILHDAVERPVPRQTDKDNQKDDYSGKQKDHTCKNELVVDTKRVIHFISPSVEGKIHDKTLCDSLKFRFPDRIGLFQDLGYLGYRPENIAEVFIPVKKTKYKPELNEEEIAYNSFVGTIRVTVEHVIGAFQTLRIVRDTIRIKGEIVRDTVAYVAAALHNLRNYSRNPKFVT